MLVLSMDPNNQNPQGDSGALNKLEQDLQNLTAQVASTAQTSPLVEQPVQPTSPVPDVVPSIPTPIIPPPVMPTPVPITEPIETGTPIQETPKKGSPLMVVAIILAVVAVLAVVAYVFGTKLLAPKTTQVACTMEAKICPDGSSVGRVAPNCEFAVCPSPTATTDPTVSWKIFIHKSGYSIKYPDTIKIIPMKMAAPDNTPDEEYPDIMISSNTGFDKPHLRILRLVKDFSDTKLSLIEIAQKYYQANLDMTAVPATSIQEPTQGTFLGVPSVSYIVKNKAFKSIVDEYLGYSGNYHVIWLEKDDYKYMIYWTEDLLMDQILSTFKFIEATTSGSPTTSPSSSPTTSN
jgi:hypothetical protein